MTDALTPSARIVVVTGAAAGIGLATARAFAEAGDTVVLTDIDLAAVEARAAALGDRHVGLAMDVSDTAAVARTMRAVAAHFGRIDVLVNNAGIVDPNATKVFDKPMAEVRRLIAVNLEGSHAAAQEAGRIMLAQGGGSIVNLSSGAALSALPGRTPYSMTKAAVLGLTRSLAREWAAGGVRVNAVLPGYVRTEIMASLERAGKFDPSVAGAAVPLGRMAEPAEIAAVIHHVAGAGHATGSAFLADGGVAAYGGRAAASSAPVSGRVGKGQMIVAGDADALGGAVADRFAKAGRPVVLLGRDVPDIDLTDERAVEDGVQAIATRGPIAVLIQCGATGEGDQSSEAFGAEFDRDLTGPMTLARAVAQHMAASGEGGAIVNVLPPAGRRRSHARIAADEAMVMLTRSLACEWAVHGIRVNLVTPGLVALTSDRETDAQPIVPIGCAAQPDDIAGTVAFLASDAASYVTGSHIVVDGGLATRSPFDEA